MNLEQLIAHISAETNSMFHQDIEKYCRRDNRDMYNIYFIKQKNKWRQIEEPVEPLKSIQLALLPILEQYPLSDSCICKKGHGIQDNLVVHKGARHLLKVDISKCYQNIRPTMIALELIFSNTIDEIKNLCMLYDNIWYLPTGAPTSPILCNIALTPIDREIENIFTAGFLHGAPYRYTRYLDDIIISTQSEARDWHLLDDVEQILNSYGLGINKKKSKWLTLGSDKLEATGVNLVSGGAPREIKRNLRARLHNLAITNQEINEETKGLLAHVRSIDEKSWMKLMNDYKELRESYING